MSETDERLGDEHFVAADGSHVWDYTARRSAGRGGHRPVKRSRWKALFAHAPREAEPTK